MIGVIAEVSRALKFFGSCFNADEGSQEDVRMEIGEELKNRGARKTNFYVRTISLGASNEIRGGVVVSKQLCRMSESLKWKNGWET